MSNFATRNQAKLKNFALAFGCIAAIILILYLLEPQNSSEEYQYTLQKIIQFGFPILFILSIICLYLSYIQSAFVKHLHSGWGLLGLFLIGAIFIAVPVCTPPAGSIDWRFSQALSVCWATGSLCIAFALFLIAIRLNNGFSSVLCLLGAIALAYFVGEFAFLTSTQLRDGRWVDSAHSKYVLSGQSAPLGKYTETPLGYFPRRPDNPTGTAAHRELMYDKELFDVFYTFDEKDRRITPKANRNVKADLLLFGCSFTFGYGLNDMDTWSWLLANELGPQWNVENYAYIGFGAQQMLLILEEKKFDPPTAACRQALFLAINEHIRRNSSLFDVITTTYTLDESNNPVRSKKNSESPVFTAIFTVPQILNGSQLAREICHLSLEKLVQKLRPAHLQTYLAILEKSSQILRDDYGATLTVLLWPDIEEIAPELKARGIPVLLARDMLKDWDTTGADAYLIDAKYEPHPNKKAASELAAGLAHYYKNMTLQAQTAAQ